MTQENLLLREDGYPHLPLPEVKQYNCNYCGDSGDVHRADGEWLGQCSCAAGLEITIESLRKENEQLRAQVADLKASGKAIIASEMNRTAEVIALRDQVAEMKGGAA